MQEKIGKGLYVIEEYEKIKRITVPDNQGNLLYVTTDNDAVLEHHYKTNTQGISINPN
jgi:hypothetical protein